jgi:hypothetical protein
VNRHSRKKAHAHDNDILLAVAAANAEAGSACVVVQAKRRRKNKAAKATADHWSREPSFVTEIEKAKRSLSRALKQTFAIEGIDIDIRFATGFRVRSLPRTADAALVLDLPGKFRLLDTDVGKIDDVFSVTYSLAPWSESALWRPETGLRERGKYGGSVAVHTSLGTSKRTVSFIYQTSNLGTVLGKSRAVIELATNALYDIYEASTQGDENQDEERG